MKLLSHQADRRIFFNFLFVGIFLVLAKLAGATKEVAVAWRYGLSPAVDAYVFVFNLLAWPGAILGGAPFFALLPPLVARWRKTDVAALGLFRAELLGFILCFGVVASAVGPSVLWVMFTQGWIRQTSAQLAQALDIVFPLGGMIIPGLFIALFSAWTLAEGKQLNTLLEGVPACIISVFLLYPISFVLHPLVWGTVIGFFLQALMLAYPLWRSKVLQCLCFGFSSPVWADFVRNCKLLIFGQIALSLSGTLDLIVAAQIGVGGLSALSYANRILMLLVSLGGIAISRATLPVFSELQANKGAAALTGAKWAKYMFFFGLFISFVSYFFAPWCVRILFERGAFDASATMIVSENFRYALVQLPFYFSWVVFTSLLSAQWNFKLLTIIFTINLLVKAVALCILVPHLGINGIQLSSSVMYMISLGFLFIIGKKYLKKSVL